MCGYCGASKPFETDNRMRATRLQEEKRFIQSTWCMDELHERCAGCSCTDCTHTVQRPRRYTGVDLSTLRDLLHTMQRECR